MRPCEDLNFLQKELYLDSYKIILEENFGMGTKKLDKNKNIANC